MPIDVDKAVGATFAPTTYEWSDRDVILYHLALGAGNPPTDENELRYAYEGDLHVLPSFGTIPPFGTMMSLGSVEGLDVNLASILHGEQEIEIHEPITTSGTVTQEGRVTDIFDKGKGAVIVMEIVSTDEKSGEPMFTNRSSIFVRGEGGFGGDSGPAAASTIPDREPDHVVESPTMPQQALLYRMSSGDLNPLHADPGFAMFAGFERPILHGLCTYGIALKAVVDTALGHEPGVVTAYKARFSGSVYPGETVVTRVWETDDGVALEATTAERGESVLSNGLVTAG
ncbi:MAG: MaoC/PaaZ C-terminal domain-containing protein [Acidimicrobiia bacterium]